MCVFVCVVYTHNLRSKFLSGMSYEEIVGFVSNMSEAERAKFLSVMNCSMSARDCSAVLELMGDVENWEWGKEYEYEYDGEWRHGLKHGQGKLMYPTGNYFLLHFECRV